METWGRKGRRLYRYNRRGVLVGGVGESYQIGGRSRVRIKGTVQQEGRSVEIGLAPLGDEKNLRLTFFCEAVAF